MRLLTPLVLMLCLAACQRSGQNNDEAVRQGIVEHYLKVGVNVEKMNIKMATPKYSGDTADVEVTVSPKDRTDIPGTPFKYHLERQNGKWKVVGRAAEGHGGDPNAAPTNPHGGEMPPAGGSGKMPSPSDLPPSKK